MTASSVSSSGRSVPVDLALAARRTVVIMTDLHTYATHSPYSDPGQHAALIAAVPPEPAAIHRVAWNTILHYRAGDVALSDEQRGDIDRRWLSALLDVRQERASGPLDAAPAEPERQLAGCCRDHTLLAVSVFRQHRVPARSRVGFAGYFTSGFHHDHVVAEYWNGTRWVRFDPEPSRDYVTFDPHDMPTGSEAPFQTAAEVWRSIRNGDVDPAMYGVDPSMPHLGGAGFVRGYVIAELAHRMRDELLLWDVWGAAIESIDGHAPDHADEQADIIADLLVRADAEDTGTDHNEAEAELARRYASEPGLAPGRIVTTMSPMGHRGDTDLVARTTTWKSQPVPDYTVPTL